MKKRAKVFCVFCFTKPATRNLVLMLLMICLFACNIPGNLTITNLSGQYDSETGMPSPEMKVFNLNDSISNLYLRFPLDELKYKKSRDSSFVYASFRLKFQLYDSYEKGRLVDTFSCSFIDTLKDSHNNIFERDFVLKARRGSNFLLEITLTDFIKGAKCVKYITFLKKANGARSDFLVQKIDNTLVYDNIITQNSWYKIKTNNESIKSLSVRFYHLDFPIALPPFSFYEPKPFKYKADSIFSLAMNNGESELFDMKKKGFYHIQSDTSGKDGITLFRFDDDFPYLKTAESIIPPVRYLTTEAEYESLEKSANKKEAIDNFWLAIAGNPNRAKTLIKNYYKRVTYANKYFTSYLEGWKTDRGMIYIILGKPGIVYRSDYSETWIYGAKGNLSSTRFEFVNVNNPFTDNDFLLVRIPGYKDIWYMNVDNWRR